MLLNNDLGELKDFKKGQTKGGCVETKFFTICRLYPENLKIHSLFHFL